MDYIRRMHMKLSLFARYPAMNCRKSVARSIREVRGPCNTGIHPEFSGCELDTYVPPSLPLPLTITLTSFRNYLHLNSIRSSPMIASVSMPRLLLLHLLLLKVRPLQRSRSSSPRSHRPRPRSLPRHDHRLRRRWDKVHLNRRFRFRRTGDAGERV